VDPESVGRIQPPPALSVVMHILWTTCEKAPVPENWVLVPRLVAFLNHSWAQSDASFECAVFYILHVRKSGSGKTGVAEDGVCFDIPRTLIVETRLSEGAAAFRWWPARPLRLTYIIVFLN
jgi:hypothetical protein